ncbi:MAG: VanZ family protein [Woeseiaceae bacterium]|nr:VanZ family protein [Woeseiaceae bacterium]
MLPLRHERLWLIASLVLLLVVLAAALVPSVWFWNDKVRVLSWFDNFDKWLHAITFLVLAIWFAGQHGKHAYWRIAVGLLLFGLMIELCQFMVSYRSASLADFGANTAGIITGLAVAAAGLGGWSLRVEDWFAARNTGIG